MQVEIASLLNYLIHFLSALVLCYGCHIFMNITERCYAKVYTFVIILTLPIIDQYSYYLPLLIGMSFGVICGKGNIYQRLLIPLMIQELLYSVLIFFIMTEIYMLTHSILKNEESALGIFMIAAAYLFIGYLMKKYKQYHIELKKEEWRILFLLACCYQILLHLFGIALLKNNMEITIVMLIQLLMMLSFYFLFLFIYIGMIKKKEEELKLSIKDLNEKLSNMMETQLKDTYEGNRKIRHDLKNHIILLQHYLKHNEIEEAQQYLHKINDTIGEDMIQLTKNEALNYILNTKSFRMNANKIKITMNIYDDLMMINAFDIVTIFGNLLDNALLGCKGIEKPWVHILIGQQANHIVIEIKNSCDSSQIQVEKNQLQTSKREDGHGLGISNVITCVKRNMGNSWYTFEDNIFTFHIDLYDETYL